MQHYTVAMPMSYGAEVTMSVTYSTFIGSWDVWIALYQGCEKTPPLEVKGQWSVVRVCEGIM